MHVESHGHHESSQDFHNHRQTYDGFLRMASIGTAWVLCIVVALAIGGTAGRWGLSSIVLILGSVAAVLGMAIRGWDWKPPAAVVVLGLLALLLISH